VQHVHQLGTAEFLRLFLFIRVFKIQIIAIFDNGSDIHLSTNVAFLSVVPPLTDGFKLLDLNRARFIVGFLSFGQAVFVVPNLLGRRAFVNFLFVMY
jgi:hypothetical protein